MGCGSSVPISTSIREKKHINGTKSSSTIRKTNFSAREKSGQLSPLEDSNNRKENLEPLILISLDEQYNENEKKLRSLIDYCISFPSVQQCEEYFTDPHLQSFIFLILPIEHLHPLVSRIHSIPKLYAIYLTESNAEKSYSRSKRSIDDYPKIKGIFDDRVDLYRQMDEDIEIFFNVNDLIPVTVYSRLDAIQSNGSSSDHLRFLFYQIFFHQFCDNAPSDVTRTDLIESIRPYYSSNRRLSKLVDQFHDDYQSSNVFSWFSNDSFVRRLLTQSLLQINVQMLFLFRFFLRDVHKTMIKEDAPISNTRYSNSFNGSNRYLNSRSINEQMFYRGQALAKETFFKIKSSVGELLSMNNYFFASRHRHSALGYLRRHVQSSECLYRVLFEIKVPGDYSQQKKRPFIDVKSTNLGQSLSSENEDLFQILFSIGSIFRINNAEFDLNNDSWIIQVTLYDERSNEDFSQMFRFLNQTDRTSHENITILANLLRQISPPSAEQFYRHLLKEKSDHFSQIECYRGLGLCAYSQKNYDQALNYFEKAFQLKPTDNALKSSLHHNLGLVYAQLNDTSKALDHFHRALETSSMPLHRACVHHNLALVHGQQGEYEEELNHYEEALKIRSERFPDQHLQLASLHNNIGISYSELNRYDRALSSLKSALQIRLKLLPEDHLDIARSYANIGTVYVKTKEYSMALDYFDKAKKLFEKQIPIPEFDLEQLNRNIKIVNDKNRRKTR